MSETFSVRRVTSVSTVEREPLVDAVGFAALITAGLLGGLAAVAASALSAAISGLLRQGASSREIAPVHDVRRIGHDLAQRARTLCSSLPISERRKVEALAAAAPYVVRAADVEAHVRSLIEARTAAEVGAAARTLREAAERSHTHVLLRSIDAACRAASIRAGFPVVHTTETGGGLRVVAEDRSGRALVTEIELCAGAPVLRAEVVGVADGTCHAIADRYLRALAQAGIRYSDPPIRRATGGVPVLEGSREYVRGGTRTDRVRARTGQLRVAPISEGR